MEMSQGITSPASDGLWSLPSYWRNAKAQLDWEIAAYMCVYGDVQPVVEKYKRMEVQGHLYSAAGMLGWWRSKHCPLQ